MNTGRTQLLLNVLLRGVNPMKHLSVQTCIKLVCTAIVPAAVVKYVCWALVRVVPEMPPWVFAINRCCRFCQAPGLPHSGGRLPDRPGPGGRFAIQSCCRRSNEPLLPHCGGRLPDSWVTPSCHTAVSAAPMRKSKSAGKVL